MMRCFSREHLLRTDSRCIHRAAWKVWGRYTFVEDTGRSTFAAGRADQPSERNIPDIPFEQALMQKGETAVVECPAISPAFFKADVIFHFFGDGGTILVARPTDGFKAISFIQHGFNGDTRGKG